MSKNFSITLQSAVRTIPDRCIKVGEKLGTRFTFHDAGLIGRNRSGGTEGANTCLIANINLGEYNYLLHLAPEFKAHKSEENVTNCLDNVMRILRNKTDRSKEKPTAVITGGRWFGEKDAKSTESMDFMNLVANFFEEKGIPLSIIFGKKKPGNLDNAYVYNKCMTIWNKGLNGAKLEKNPTREQVEEALLNSYECVEIAPEHKIDLIVS